MKRNRNRHRQQQPKTASAQQEERLSPAEYRQKMIDDDVKRLQGGGYRLVEQKTKDTAETRNFINILDRLMYRARMNASTRGCRFTNTDLDTEFLPRIEAAKESLNLVAAELSSLMGIEYRPPRGYSNPLKKKQPVQQKEGKAKPVDAEKAATTTLGGKAGIASATPAAKPAKKTAKGASSAAPTEDATVNGENIVQLPVSPSAVARASETAAAA